MREVNNKFAYAFNKISAPKPNETDLKAYARKVNDALEGLYAQINGYIQMNNLSTNVKNAITESAKAIGWIVKNDQNESTFIISPEAMNAISQNINLTGKVTFASLNPDMASMFGTVDGHTVIDGSSIKTGTIEAERIDAEELKINHIRTKQVTGRNEYGVLLIDGADYSQEEEGDPYVSLRFLYGNENGIVMPEPGEAYGLEIFSDPSYARIKSARYLDIGVPNPGSEYEGDVCGFMFECDSDYEEPPTYSPYIFAKGHLLPFIDSTGSGSGAKGYALGRSQNRWKYLYVYGGQYTGSDRNYKENINDIPLSHAEAFVMGLKPVVYNLKGEDQKEKHLGFIAQDVGETLNRCGMDQDYAVYEHNHEGHYSLNYQEFIAPMVSVIQKQQKQIESLTSRIERLEKLLEGDLK